MTKPIEITERSRVPLYVLYALVLLTAGLSWRAAQFAARVDTNLEQIKRHMRSDWTLDDQEKWAMRLARDNPSLRVPEPAIKAADLASNNHGNERTQ